MNLEEAIAELNLGASTISQMPKIALECIMSGKESESLLILAGMSETDNSFEIRQYLDQAINELSIKSNTGLEAAYVLANYYVIRLQNKNIDIIDAITKIKNDCWNNCEMLIDSNKYLYDGIQFHGIIGFWYEYMEIDENTEWVKNLSLIHI